MAQTLNDYRETIGIKLRDTSNGIVEESNIDNFINRACRRLQTMHEFPGTKHYASLNVFEGEYKYAIPTGYRGMIDFLYKDESAGLDERTSAAFWKDVKWETDIFADDNDGDTKLFLIKYSNTNPVATLTNADSVTGWSTGGDATNITLDEIEYVYGSSCLNFDIDVSASVDDFAEIENSTLAAVDLSDHENKSTLFTRVYIPDVTNITSLTLFWGSDDSNYWEQTVSEQHHGVAFKNGWNIIGFDWNGATSTGTPTTSNDFVKFRISYTSSQTDETDIRLERITSKLPTQLTVNFYSRYMVKTASGTYQEEFTSGDDESILESHHEDMLMYLALEEGFDVQREANDSAKARANFREMFDRAANDKISEKSKPSDSYYYQF